MMCALRQIQMLQKTIMVKKNSHNPSLNTIEMVEKLVQQKKEFPSKHKLWTSLPKKVQYPTFLRILNYLEKSYKIGFDRRGNIVWIFADNPKLKKMMKSGTKYY